MPASLWGAGREDGIVVHDHTCSDECAASEPHLAAMERDAHRQVAEADGGDVRSVEGLGQQPGESFNQFVRRACREEFAAIERERADTSRLLTEARRRFYDGLNREAEAIDGFVKVGADGGIEPLYKTHHFFDIINPAGSWEARCTGADCPYCNNDTTRECPGCKLCGS